MAKSPDAVDKRVGTMLLMRRRMLNLTQAEVANAVGVSFQQLQKYEKGTNRVSASRLQEIATLLQVSPHFFFGELADTATTAPSSKPSNPPDDILKFMASTDGLRLIKAFSQVKQQRLRKAIIHLVEALND